MNAMILPHITYCFTSWSQTYNTTLKPFETVYNQAFCKVLEKEDAITFSAILNSLASSILTEFVQTTTVKAGTLELSIEVTASDQ